MTAMTTQSEDLSVIELQIKGLRRHGKEESPDNVEELSLTVPKDTTMTNLWDKIVASGFETPMSLSSNEQDWRSYSQKLVIKPFDEIDIAKNTTPGDLAIGLDETLLAYGDRRFGKALQLDIEEDAESRHGACECLQDSRGLKITFLRTTRMPDDDKLHALPAALGTFPLYNVQHYADALPDKMVHEGGVFMPMWQREALWISFESRNRMRYAIRISIGRINAVSGREMEEKSAADRETSEPVQDYVVVPGQDWLDGISVGPGVVRQFVAMPLGSGYTVEGQKTGEEKHGGLQIELIPAYQTAPRQWAPSDLIPNDPEEFLRTSYNLWLKDYDTPRELGYQLGGKIRAYPRPAYEWVPNTVSDVAIGGERRLEMRAGYPTRRASTERSYGRESIRVSAPASRAAYSGADEDAPTASGVDSVKKNNTLAETVNLDTKKLKSMGLAAGGKLMQDIYEDKNDARIWNTAASKLVHVHILDPASCEAVTHIVPPPPPIDAEEYAKSNMPLFVVEEKPDERLEGGDFDTVDSVSAMDKKNEVAGEQALDPTKPTKCRCGVRLCDCVVRPCTHQFCHQCIKDLDPEGSINWSSATPTQKANWKCPTCQTPVSYVAGFSAPMNLPGEETIKVRVPVHVLEVNDGRMQFKSVHKSKM